MAYWNFPLSYCTAHLQHELTGLNPNMAADLRTPRLAVLIDADNASSRIATRLFEEIAKIIVSIGAGLSVLDHGHHTGGKIIIA